jgi:hypothetical protein
MRISASSQLAYLRENLFHLSCTCVPLWHPLGFVSCLVRSELDHFAVRVHYWPKNERRPKRPDWPIHTHVYDLSSLVLMGRVRDVQFREKTGLEHAVYSVSYDGDDSAISDTGQHLSIEAQIDDYHSVGEEYFVPKGTFHCTYVSRTEFALTLVALSNFEKASPLVLGQSGRESEPYGRQPFDKEVFWHHVHEAFATIPQK